MQQIEILRAVERLVHAHLGAHYRAVLFGSAAKGTDVEGSDLDVAIVGPAPIPWETLTVLRRAVSAIPTLRKVDLVDAETAGESLRSEILRDAQTL